MKPQPPSFWKQPRGMVVLGVGGVLLLATGWIAYSRLGPTPASEAYTPPAHRIDENALVAANAERPGEAAAPAPPAADNAVEAASSDAPAAADAAPADAAKPGDGRSDLEEIIDDAGAAVDDAVDEVEDALGGKDDDK